MRYDRDMIILVLSSENDTEKVFTNSIQDQAGNRFKGFFCPKFYHPLQLFSQTRASIIFFHSGMNIYTSLIYQ